MDYLDFDSKLLNIGARYLAKSLSHLLNLSLRQSYIPKEWKMAFVTAIYKRKGKTDDLSNYRPISILPTIGKLLEFAVKEQVVHYLLANKLITDQQSAYLPDVLRKHHCMELLTDGLLALTRARSLLTAVSIWLKDLTLFCTASYLKNFLSMVSRTLPVNGLVLICLIGFKG